ncbi:MAG: UDP-N-acetylenolpyruvoylglucosamine reductase [Chlamydiales bacterium]|jgi:UDP-N-acetylmuramate dehydrogenase|nr:UDP-N-acetylenolpyruvoylglucosamine reductase [Chlamydiales bacterium]
MVDIKKNIPLAPLCTLGIGGNASYFAEAYDIEQLQYLFTWCKENDKSFLILGKGSNCLFDDRGFNGLVILNKIQYNKQKDNFFEVGAGYSFPLLGQQTARKGFSGLEFAAGIPATVGGAVFMNAGANKQEIADTLFSVDYLFANGHLVTFLKEELAFEYRKSPFQKMKGAIVGATFKLVSSTTAKETQRKIVDYRLKTQPYGSKSAGCIFCNPSLEVSAGKLIEQCGLKGLNIKGAAVSEKHANFLINKDHSTAADMLSLIDHVKSEVADKTGIQLKTEVRYIPYEHD